MSEVKEGYVGHIIFRNPENGYTVMTLVGAENEDEITCVGCFPAINEGAYVSVTGELVNHASYGEQFSVSSLTEKRPETKEAIERYLGSGAIKGIGMTLANRIVRKFGEKAFDILEWEPERLAEIKGISLRMAREISKQFNEQKAQRDTMIYLQQYGISTGLSVKIYERYKDRTKEILTENPYRLTEDIDGVGFKIADEIAGRIGVREDSEYRIRAAILYTLQNAESNGHIYLPLPRLLNAASDILGLPEEVITHELGNLCLERKLIRKTKKNGEETEEQVYLAACYYTELSVARMLHDLNISYSVRTDALRKKLSDMEEKLGIHYDEVQKNAVLEAAKSGVFVLTGGPGTGKTTTINAIIRYFEEEGMDILLAAPTGRAAKRMTEATKMESRTIHRLLEVSMMPTDESHGRYGRNEENPLETDVVIIDEMSMVDIFLMEALLRAIVPGTRLILVGDSNQLPSVGPGNVLKDIMASGCFRTVCLQKIFRQAEESDIIVNAHRINRGEQIKLENKDSKDFFLVRRNDTESVIQTMLPHVTDRLPRYVKAKPYEIQVLTPMRKGELGVENLNRVLQQALNPPAPSKIETEYRDIIFREGDKVMQIKNNYQLTWQVRNRYGIAVSSGEGVFNGDMGVIKQINTFAEEMEVMFDEEHIVTYAFNQLEELEHAYAITIHKSQGSEYPAVIMPLLGGPKMLFCRNLLYTGVTRASKCVMIIGTEEIVRNMIRNEDEQKRFTGLRDRITELP